MVGNFLADHDRGPIQIAIGDAREDRAVGDTQARDADDTTMCIDDRSGIIRTSHARSATGVIGAFGMLSDEYVPLRLGLFVRARAASGQSPTCLPTWQGDRWLVVDQWHGLCPGPRP